MKIVRQDDEVRQFAHTPALNPGAASRPLKWSSKEKVKSEGPSTGRSRGN
jgi:hypothetical protein